MSFVLDTLDVCVCVFVCALAVEQVMEWASECENSRKNGITIGNHKKMESRAIDEVGDEQLRGQWRQQ